MKLKKLTAGLMMAGACGLAFADMHTAPNEQQVFTLGEAPNLSPYEEALVVGYEGMMSIIGAMVAADSCFKLQEEGPFPFTARMQSTQGGTIDFGAYEADQIQLTVSPVISTQYYGTKWDLQLTDPGVLYNPNRGGLEVSNLSLIGGVYPAFSAGSAIYVVNTKFDIENWPGGAVSSWDEHIIKDFYRLAEGKEQVPSCDSIGAELCDERTFYDWGLEVITKYDYPFYKYRQDSAHTPWNGVAGNWTVRKELITPNANSTNTTYCVIVASGSYFAPGGDISYDGEVTVTAPITMP